MTRLGVLLGLSLAAGLLGAGAGQAATMAKPITNINKVTVKAPVGPHTYTFTMTTFKITDTRSVHEDTDFASVASAVGTASAVPGPTKSMGNLNNGTYTANISVTASALPTDSVSFTYGIINSGYDANKLETNLKKAIESAAEKAAKAGLAAAANTALPGSGAIASSIGSAGTDWFIGKLLDIVFANCDGSVAGGNHVFSGSQLAAQTAGGKTISGTDDNKGTDSATGCGANSRYYVSWTIKG